MGVIQKATYWMPRRIVEFCNEFWQFSCHRSSELFWVVIWGKLAFITIKIYGHNFDGVKSAGMLGHHAREDHYCDVESFGARRLENCIIGLMWPWAGMGRASTWPLLCLSCFSINFSNQTCLFAFHSPESWVELLLSYICKQVVSKLEEWTVVMVKPLCR